MILYLRFLLRFILFYFFFFVHSLASFFLCCDLYVVYRAFLGANSLPHSYNFIFVFLTIFCFFFLFCYLPYCKSPFLIEPILSRYLLYDRGRGVNSNDDKFETTVTYRDSHLKITSSKFRVSIFLIQDQLRDLLDPQF